MRRLTIKKRKRKGQNESGNQKTDKMVYGRQIRHVYPLGAVRNSGLRGMDDVREGDAGQGV